MPKISVIVPVYKVEKYLQRCVDSILAQTFTDFDLILVDDGSPDGCPIICDEYVKKDNRVHVIHKPNGGLSDARNAGIDWTFANSDSQFLTFIDSDDWVHEKYLEILLNAINKTGLGISACRYYRTKGEDFSTALESSFMDILKVEDFFCEKYAYAILAVCKLYKKSLFVDVRYPVGRLHEDEFTTYKILFNNKEIVFWDLPLYAYYNNPTSITMSKWTPKRMDGYDAYEEQIRYFKENNFYGAMKFMIGVYVSRILDSLSKFKREKPKNKIAIKLYKKRKKNFSKYAKMLSFHNASDEWILYKIYPNRMKFFVFLRALKGKLKRIFKTKSN